MWLSEEPVWVEQWPLTSEKLAAAEELVEQQLLAGHIEPSNSPWNTPIFVIKKKSGKWRLLQDLRAINKTMETMGALQPGLPSPVAIPKDYAIIVIDLQDCFFTIPLHKKDRKRFAFSVPSSNFTRPYQRYQWKVLPQGMKNSPTLCQKYVDQAICNIRQKYKEIYLIHYMDDILLAHKDKAYLHQALQDMMEALQEYGLKVAPEKIQTEPPYNYLGRLIQEFSIQHIPFQLRTDHLVTLNDFQKFLGDINWIRPLLKITTVELKPLFLILQGDSNPLSPRELTVEGKLAIEKIEEALKNVFIKRLDYTKPWDLIILRTPVIPTGLLWQNGPLEWIHLAASPKKIVASYPFMVSLLIIKGRKRSRELFGKDMDNIIIPYNKDQLEALLLLEDSLGIALASFRGQILFHLPKSVLLQFFKEHMVVFPIYYRMKPLEEAILVFTDGSSSGRAAYIINNEKKVLNTENCSAQQSEIMAVIEVIKLTRDKKINLYTDSLYIVKLFPAIETAAFPGNKSTIIKLLKRLQKSIWKRTQPYYVGHIRAHSGLPGPLAEGNASADALTKIFIIDENKIQEAIKSHQLHHQNANALRYQFSLTRETAREIVKNCSVCPTQTNVPQQGVNPRGLRANDLWQMDVTHVPSFGKLSYVHVCVDTFSHVIVASARTGEAFKDVCQHLMFCFSYLGIPRKLKTDNGPAYVSKSFQQLCQQFGIAHSTGIPYNPQGQAIIERTNQVLKNMIYKLQYGDLKYFSPYHLLNHSMFVLNYLNMNNKEKTPMMRHWEINEENIKPKVLWKDVLTGKWNGPDTLLTSGRGYACIFPQNFDSPIWIPDRLIRHPEVGNLSKRLSEKKFHCRDGETASTESETK